MTKHVSLTQPNEHHCSCNFWNWKIVIFGIPFLQTHSEFDKNILLLLPNLFKIDDLHNQDESHTIHMVFNVY